MRIIAVSVGLPQEYGMGGKTIRTSIVKKPIRGAVAIGATGVEGDRPAVHPEAVYAYCKEHYGYWSKELGLPHLEEKPGYFGENLTVEGFDEETLQIGDVLEIGQVRLQVVAPRMPCFKLSWRLQQDESFLRRFTLSGKTGFYLKVLQPGLIQAGDPIVYKPYTKKTMTIREISQFLGHLDQATEEDVDRVLSQEYLGITARTMVQERRVMMQDLKLMRQHRWEGWKSLEVDQVVHESDGVKSYYLKSPTQEPLANYRPGQFLTCRLRLQNGEECIRTWTLSDYPKELPHYRLTIKKVEEGKGSHFMHKCMEKGATLSVKPPNGSFYLDRSTFKHIVFISAGIGITPMIAMLKAHLDREIQPVSPVYFIHVARNGRTFSFAEELKALKKREALQKHVIYFTKPEPLDEGYDRKGRFCVEDLKEIMRGNKVCWGNKWVEWPATDGLFYLCGPVDFQDSVKNDLIAWGVSKTKIFTESFYPQAGGPTGVKAEKATVYFSKSNIWAEWNQKEDITLLELAEKAGIQAPNACRMGVCETCECPVRKGKIYYEHGPHAMRSEETVLPCCAKPGSEILELDL